MFQRKQAESDKLPPTKAALEQAILRAHYECIVWVNDVVPNPVLPNPLKYEWRMEDSSFVPIMTTLPLAQMPFSCLSNVAAQKQSAQRLNANARPINWFVQNYVYVGQKKMFVKIQKVIKSRVFL